MPKKPIIIISVLCVIALALGYWSGQDEQEVTSGSDLKSSENKEPEFLRDGLVAYYPFNGNAEDESGNGNDGILKGAKPEFVIQPSVGNGFKITRDSWVEIPHSEAINPKGSRTISFFFQGDEEGRIFSNRHEQIARNWNFNFNYEKGLIGIELFENYSRCIQLTFQLPDLKNIYHYTITFNTLTGSFRAYINGEITAQDPFEFKDPNDTVHRLGENDLIGFSNSQGVVPLEIGRDAAYPSSAIDTGFISALRFYDRALSEDEVKALYEFEKGSGEGKRRVASSGDVKSSERKEPEFLEKGLVAYYPFNGNAEDESGNGHDGEVFGPVLVSDRNQRAESAYNFDGINDYIDVGNIIKKLDDVTFSVWFLQTKISSPLQMCLVMKRREPTGGGVTLSSSKGVVSGGYVNFGVRNPLRTDDEKWHHAVYSLGRKKMEIFIDGVSVDVLGVETGETFSNENIWIGRGFTHDVDTGGNRAFKGFIDDVRIYNRALSADEVKALYEFEMAN